MRESFQGYLTKLSMRRKRTVLVEGASDKKIIDRLVCAKTGVGDLVVDTVEHVDSPSAEVLSNRQKVERLHGLFSGDRAHVAAFVDREYRGYDKLGFPAIDSYLDHNKEADTCFWTLGHSVENYFLSPDFLESYLQEQFPEGFDSAAKAKISASFDSILMHAAALSIAANEHEMIKRLSNFFKFSHFEVYEGNPFLLFDYASIKSDLILERGIDSIVVDSIISRISSLLVAAKVSDPILIRKMCHGHLSMNIVRAATAALLRQNYSLTRAVEISHGSNDVLLRKLVNHLCLSKLGDFWFPIGLYNWI